MHAPDNNTYFTMTGPNACRQEIDMRGFAIIHDVFTPTETAAIIAAVDVANTSGANFRRGEGLFAIRRFLKEVPAAIPHIFSGRLNGIIKELFGEGYFVVKSIYFDKPGNSNWFVAWHQDLTIAVATKVPTPGYGPWTVKDGQYGVQPPLGMLQDNFTVRIHLDDTDVHNGALRVRPGSHLGGVIRNAATDNSTYTEAICNVPQGGIMVMKPLLLHASGRTTDDRKRRVVHIEFSRASLPDGIQWAERM